MGNLVDFADDLDMQARIKVVGVGGGGGNALNTMIESGLEGVEFIAANTDQQALDANLAPVKIQLGPQLTKGLGAGGNPDQGRKAATEDLTKIAECLEGADMVFVTAGMGGGTGTGAAPVIAQVAKDCGALTVGVVTRPFQFEGRRRMKNASTGIEEFINAVDSIITIPNEKLLTLDADMTMLESFERADDVLVQAVRGISDLIVNAGMINVDFADVRTIMSNNGRALMGTGCARGERRAIEAAEMAINSPLLDDVTVDGATGILINFTTGPDIKLREVNEAALLIQESAHEDANIIFGVVTDPDQTEEVKVTVIATGFEEAMAAPSAGAGMGRMGRAAHHSAMSSQRGSVAPRHTPNPQYGHRPEPRDSHAPRPSRRHAEAAQAPTDGRAFGASAMHDEAVLDIPAYLRRSIAE